MMCGKELAPYKPGVSIFEVVQQDRPMICKRVDHGYLSWIEAYILQEVEDPYLNHGTIQLKQDGVCMFQEPALGDLWHMHDQVGVECFEQIVRGVAALHQRGFVHSDVKPSNVLVFPDHLRLADFGHTLKMEWRHPPGWGTANIRAPEMDLEGWDEQVDLWGLGVILFLLSTGEMPWKEGERDLFCREYPQSVEKKSPHPLCISLLHPDPGKRTTMTELCQMFSIPFRPYNDHLDFERHLLKVARTSKWKGYQGLCREIARQYTNPLSIGRSHNFRQASLMCHLLPQLSL